MLLKTKAIVLHTIKFRESSIIVRVFAELLGIKTYIVNQVRSSKSKKFLSAYFQPLTLLEMVVYQRDTANVQRIAELHLWQPYRTIPFSIVKQTQVLFLTEIIHKTLKEESPHVELFHFIAKSLLFLDQQKEHFENFHLIFLIRYSYFLGFGMDSAEEIESQLRQFIPFNEQEMKVLDVLLSCDYADLVILEPLFRRKLLDAILIYYRLHMESLGEIYSLKILRELT